MKIVIVKKYKCVLQLQRSILKSCMYDGQPILNRTSPEIRLNINTSIRSQGKYLVLHEQVMATGELKLIER